MRAWILAVTLLVGACGPNAAAPTPAPSSVPVAPGPNSSAQPSVDAALQDAAAHLGTTPDQLRVERVEARDWPDSSLGCPKPGLMYSQIVTPGFLVIIVGPGGRQLEYHTDARGRVVLCRES